MPWVVPAAPHRLTPAEASFLHWCWQDRGEPVPRHLPRDDGLVGPQPRWHSGNTQILEPRAAEALCLDAFHGAADRLAEDYSLTSQGRGSFPEGAFHCTWVDSPGEAAQKHGRNSWTEPGSPQGVSRPSPMPWD